jgi:hypothetical protein
MTAGNIVDRVLPHWECYRNPDKRQAFDDMTAAGVGVVVLSRNGARAGKSSRYSYTHGLPKKRQRLQHRWLRKRRTSSGCIWRMEWNFVIVETTKEDRIAPNLLDRTVV